jgi:CD2 antigen cytoplasmic tail-binding protein 2
MTRKGRVKTEGYDSDSSDDGEGVVLSRREKNDAAAGDEDDDMFAMGEKEDKEDADDVKPKKQEFLRLGDIEGQEFNEEGSDGKDEDESDASDEPEDEDDAERRKKAGMGYELSSFNMREEFEEGKFDADGTFVRTFDPHAMHDRWMEGTDEREIKKARRAKRAQEKKEKERIKAERWEAERGGRGKDDMEKELLSYLKRGESVLEALSRLGERVKKDKEKEKR